MKSKVMAFRVLVVVGLVAAMFTVSRPSLKAMAFGSSGAVSSGHQLTRPVAALRAPRMGQNARQSSGPPALTTVPSQIVRDRGFVLEAPGALPPISKAAATARLIAAFGHEKVTIREAVLADVHEASQTDQSARPDWVMSIMPVNGIQNAADSVVQVKYMVAFVSAEDAQSPIYTISAGVPINAPVACCDTSHAVDAP